VFCLGQISGQPVPLSILGGGEPVHLRVIFGDEGFDTFGVHEVLFEAVKNSRLDAVSADGEEIVAGAFVARRRTSIVELADL